MVQARMTRTVVQLPSMPAPLPMADLQLAFALRNVPLGPILLAPLGIARLLIGSIRIAIEEHTVITLGPGDCCGAVIGALEDGARIVSHAVNDAGEAIGDVVSATADGAVDIVNAAGDHVNAAGEAIAGTAEDVGGAIVDGAEAVGGGIVDGANAVGGAIGSVFGRRRLVHSNSTAARRRAQSGVDGCCVTLDFQEMGLGDVLADIEAAIDGLLFVEEFSLSDFTIAGIMGEPPIFPTIRGSIVIASTFRFEIEETVDLSFIVDATDYAVQFLVDKVVARVEALRDTLVEEVLSAACSDALSTKCVEEEIVGVHFKGCLSDILPLCDLAAGKATLTDVGRSIAGQDSFADAFGGLDGVGGRRRLQHGLPPARQRLLLKAPPER